MNNFKIGDLVGLNNPANNYPVKTGVITKDESRGFSVKWTSYDKTFFMEKEDIIFEELNKLYLLSLQHFKYEDAHIYLSLVSAS